jgi:hypothetical protein
VVILSVRFNSSLSRDDVERIVRERAPRFRDVPGLVQKFYGVDGDGYITGIYVFDSQESLNAFRETDLAKTIPEAYQVKDIRIERYDVLGALFDTTPALATV